ncbi:hypothetical protein B0H17DRAFT_1220016 [Mycena rosella]|uniref:Hydrophobin n=1 Tax=Mycena rosella TaxID=1033263 RepID=A0AAD7FFQ1_MYCRO|nr:hypothetical protein B0H17DRAFT_1220016 [Mycena rosella]
MLITCILITLAAAQCTPPPPPPRSIECCSSVLPSTSTSAMAIAGIFGISLTGVNNVGESCTTVTFASQCTGNQAVECDTPDPAWHGVIALNCGPVP